MEIKELTVEEMGALVASIHNLSKDRLRELVLQIWQMAEGYEEAAADKRRLVRELDVLLNGENAAKQASLCDIVAQVRQQKLVPTCPPCDGSAYFRPGDHTQGCVVWICQQGHQHHDSPLKYRRENDQERT